MYMDELWLAAVRKPDNKTKGTLFLRSVLKHLFEIDDGDTALLMMEHRRQRYLVEHPGEKYGFADLMGKGFLSQLICEFLKHSAK